LQILCGRIYVAQNGFGMIMKPDGCFCGLHPSGMSQKQFRSQFIFKVIDMRTNGRLHHIAIFGGMGKIAVHENGFKVF